MGLAHILVFIMLTAANAAGASDSSRRLDIEKAFTKIICQNDHAPALGQIMALGIHDARTEVRFISTNQSKGMNEATAQAQAKRMGLGQSYVSYAFGSCTANRGWVVTASARPGLFRTSDETIHLKHSAIKQVCKDYSIKFLKSDGSKSRQIKLPAMNADELSIQTKFLEPGLLTIYCRYLGERSAKSRIALQVPINQSSSLPLPFQEVFSNTKSASDLMIEWINKLRASASLPEFLPPKLSAPPTQFPGLSQLASRSTFFSKDVQALVADSSYRYETMLPGLGSDPREIAWNYWYTPEFRDKILDKRLTGAIAQNNQQAGRLGVYVSLFAGPRRR